MTPYQQACARLVESFLMAIEDEEGAYLADVDGEGHAFPLEPEDVRPLILKWAETLKETS